MCIGFPYALTATQLTSLLPWIHRKVVRRTSVNERSSLYRREHHKEAVVWQERGREAEPPDDDEDRQTDAELDQHLTLVGPH